MSMYARANPDLSEDELYDRLVESVDSVVHQPCPCCGENETRFGRLCRRCERERREDEERREVEGG